METPKGWDKMAETSDPNIREYHGTACNYLVPVVDDDASADELNTLIETVRSYVLTQVPDIADTVMAKLNLQQVVCEGIKRVQTVYTNDRNRWPKGGEYREFVKKANKLYDDQDGEGLVALRNSESDMFGKWKEALDAKLAKAEALRQALEG